MAMTVKLKISDENAESIGRPIFDKIIQLFKNEDREEFIRYFPYLKDWMTAGIFDETVEALNRLGKLLSIEYSSRSIEKGNHILAWNVQYENDENTVHWKLNLDDNHEEPMVSGFRFDR